MKKILLLIASLVISAQAVCAQVSDVEKKKLEEQVVLAIKKYEGLGLSTAQLAEKVAADLLVQAQALQDDTALDEEKSNFNKKLIIGAVVAVAVCGVGYYVYTTYFAKTSLEQACEEFNKAMGGKGLSDKEKEKLREMAKKSPDVAEGLASVLSKVASSAAGKSPYVVIGEIQKEMIDYVKKNPSKAAEVMEMGKALQEMGK